MNDDFISDLSPKECLIFLKTLLYMIKIDSKVDNRERELSRKLIKTYNAAQWRDELQKPILREELLNDIKSTISTRHKSLLLIRELLIVAHIDNEFDDKEMTFIEQVAEALNVDDNSVLELNDLILSYKLLQLRMQKIMA